MFALNLFKQPKTIESGRSFNDIKMEIDIRSAAINIKEKEEKLAEKQALKEKKIAKKAKKIEKLKKEKKEAEKKAAEQKSTEIKESICAATLIPESKGSTRVELVMTNEETGQSQVMVSTDYGQEPAQVPARENVPVVAAVADGQINDPGLEEKIRIAAAAKGITLDTAESPLAAALVSASAANVKKGSDAPKNAGRNVVRIQQ